MYRSAIAFVCYLALSTCAEAAPPDFATEIRPLFERTCLGCHGPKKQASGLRLDVRKSALSGGDSGEPAIVPGNSTESLLVRYVAAKDGLRMPPEDSKIAPWTAEQITLVIAWIDSGAKWPDELAGTATQDSALWSLAPLETKPIPRSPDDAPTANPIDAFIRAKLREQKLTPTPMAKPRDLIRRLSYDLTGLPPTFAEVQAFEADCQKRGHQVAYNELVERLLASPRYGEHWARHWLDVVHYADTHGLDHDHARPNAWPYRDYVIQSFNADKPYAQFVQEQIAGDVLYPQDPEATIGLGFLAAGPWDDTLMVVVREDTIDHLMGQVLDRDDMVSTVMSTFQGLTVHCARCHNHKFDPISQREYYSLQAVFAGIDRADRTLADADPAVRERRIALAAEKEALARRDATLLAKLDTPIVDTILAQAGDAERKRATGWRPLRVLSAISTTSPDGTTFARLADDSWLVGGTRPDKDTFIITAQTDLRDIQALRLEVLPDDSLPEKGPGRYDNGNFHLTELATSIMPVAGPTAGATKIEIVKAVASWSEQVAPIAHAIDGKADTFWGIHPKYGKRHEAVFEFKEPIGHEGGSVLVVRMNFNGVTGHQIGRFRLSLCTGELPAEDRMPQPEEIGELLRIPRDRRTAEQHQTLALHLLERQNARDIAALPPLRKVFAITNDFPATGNFKPAAKPRPIHIFTRGDLNRPGEKVAPGTVNCIPDLPGEFTLADASDESQRRAALAKWISDSRNVLTWRSIVNRVWHYHFGRGLVDTPNDFGHMGGAPSHPELLDFLAVWFRDEAKGSLKELHRLIEKSETYRQESNASPLALAQDGENRWWSHMNRRRLLAEEMRDSLLSASGQLDLTMGGPPVAQFVHRNEATFKPPGGDPAFIDYESYDPDDSANRRRSVYRFLFRTLPDPLMDALDCPDGGALTPVRTTSTTPAQALAMLNNSFVIRQSQHIAKSVDTSVATMSEKVDGLCQKILLRSPTAAEMKTFVAHAERHGLANLALVLVNSNEFLHVD